MRRTAVWVVHKSVMMSPLLPQTGGAEPRPLMPRPIHLASRLHRQAPASNAEMRGPDIPLSGHTLCVKEKSGAQKQKSCTEKAGTANKPPGGGCAPFQDRKGFYVRYIQAGLLTQASKHSPPSSRNHPVTLWRPARPIQQRHCVGFTPSFPFEFPAAGETPGYRLDLWSV